MHSDLVYFLFPVLIISMHNKVLQFNWIQNYAPQGTVSFQK